jgi:hypothetical protein
MTVSISTRLLLRRSLRSAIPHTTCPPSASLLLVRSVSSSPSFRFPPSTPSAKDPNYTPIVTENRQESIESESPSSVKRTHEDLDGIPSPAIAEESPLSSKPHSVKPVQQKDPNYKPMAEEYDLEDVGDQAENANDPKSNKRRHEDLDAVPSPAMETEGGAGEKKDVVMEEEPKDAVYPLKVYTGPFGRPFKMLKFVLFAASLLSAQSVIG